MADEQTNAILDNALYTVTATPPDRSKEAASQPTHLRFEYSAGAGGLSVIKEVDLAPSGYVINFGASIRAPARAAESEAAAGSTLPYMIQWGPAVGDIVENSRYAKSGGRCSFKTDKVRAADAEEIATQPTYEGDFRYAGVDDNYFMARRCLPVRAR